MIREKEIAMRMEKMSHPAAERRLRRLSVLSAAVAVCRPEMTAAILRFLKAKRVPRRPVLEIIMQSYLFLGYPRAIEAMLLFGEVYGGIRRRGVKPITPTEARRWYARGQALCRRVYGKNYDRLARRFGGIAPELFDWMVIEGYGKVLSRPGLSPVERELAEVAALIVEGRERQLISHLMGSINVGAKLSQLKQVAADIEFLAGKRAVVSAHKLMQRLETKNAPSK